jgi:hypothetical protein
MAAAAAQGGGEGGARKMSTAAGTATRGAIRNEIDLLLSGSASIEKSWRQQERE